MTTNHTTRAKVIKFILTAIGLAVFSAGCGILGGIIAGRFLGDGSLSDLGLAILGLLLGYIFGIVAGILAVKFIFHQRGSIIFAIIAAIIWTGVSILIAIPFNLSDNLVSTIVITSFFGVPFAALGGFYWRRKKPGS
jgi:uncharacterized membrane protein YcaP (DUF421 family)